MSETTLHDHIESLVSTLGEMSNPKIRADGYLAVFQESKRVLMSRYGRSVGEDFKDRLEDLDQAISDGVGWESLAERAQSLRDLARDFLSTHGPTWDQTAEGDRVFYRNANGVVSEGFVSEVHRRVVGLNREKVLRHCIYLDKQEAELLEIADE